MSVFSFNWGDGTTDKIYVSLNSQTGNQQISIYSDVNNGSQSRQKNISVSTSQITRNIIVSQPPAQYSVEEITSLSSLLIGDSIDVLLQNVNEGEYVGYLDSSMEVYTTTSQGSALSSNAYKWTITRLNQYAYTINTSNGYYLYSSNESSISYSQRNYTGMYMSYDSTNKWTISVDSSSLFSICLNGFDVLVINSSGRNEKYWKIYKIT